MSAKYLGLISGPNILRIWCPFMDMRTLSAHRCQKCFAIRIHLCLEYSLVSILCILYVYILDQYLGWIYLTGSLQKDTSIQDSNICKIWMLIWIVLAYETLVMAAAMKMCLIHSPWFSTCLLLHLELSFILLLIHTLRIHPLANSCPFVILSLQVGASQSIQLACCSSVLIELELRYL